VHRLRPVKSLYLARAGFIVEAAPPSLEPFNDLLAIGSDLRSISAGAFRGGHVGVTHLIFNIIESGIEERFRDAKDMVAHEPDRSVAVVNHALREPSVGNLANAAPCRAQDIDPFSQ